MNEDKKNVSVMIDDYNRDLIQYNLDLNIFEYFSRIHASFFPEIDITFMNFFISLCDQNKMDMFCIHEKELRKYELIDPYTKAIDVIHKYDLVKSRDWIYCSCTSSRFSSLNSKLKCKNEDKKSFLGITFYGSSTSPTKVYMFTPRAFKRMILLSMNPKYIEYYLLLETIFQYYYDYQIKRMKEQESVQKSKIENVMKELHTLKEYSKKITSILDKDVRDICDALDKSYINLEKNIKK